MKTKTLQFLAVAASVAMLAGCASAPERIRAQITDLTNQKRYADARSVSVKRNPGGFPQTEEEAVKAQMIRDVVNPAEIKDITDQLTDGVEGCIARRDYNGARNLIWTTGIDMVPAVAAEINPLKDRLLRERVNLAQYVQATNDMVRIVGDCLKKNDFAGARKYLHGIRPVPVWTRDVTEAIAAVRASLVRTKVPAPEAEKAVTAARAFLEELFADNALRAARIAAGSEFKPDDRDFRTQLDAFKAALAAQGCGEQARNQAVAVITQVANPALRALWRPVKDGVSPPTAIGTTRLNAMIDEMRTALYKQRVVPAQIAFRARELREKILPLVEAGKLEEARAAIHSYGVTGYPEIDDAVFAVKLGLLNARVNVAEWETRREALTKAVEEALARKDFEGASAVIAADAPVPVYGAAVDQALGTAASEASKIGAPQEGAEAVVADARVRLDDVIAPRPDFNRESRILQAYADELAGLAGKKDEDAPDWSAVRAALDNAAKWLVADDMPKDAADALMNDVMAGFMALVSSGADAAADALTTEQLNRMLAELKAELSARISAAVAEKMAADAAAEADRMRQIALEMAARAAAAVDFDTRINGFVEAVSDRAEPDVNRILADGARALRLRRAGANLSAEDATSLFVAAVYMGYDDVMHLAFTLGADVNAPAAKDGLARPALLLALQYGFRGRASDILAKADRSVRDARGDGVVHYAVRGGNGAALVDLLREGADTRTPGFGGATPIVLAADLGYAGFVQALIPFSELEKADAAGFTALLRAAQNGRTDIVRMLVAAGASLKAKTVNGDGALELAAMANAPALLDYLLDDKKIAPTARVVSQLVIAGNVPTLQRMIAHGAKLQDAHLAVAVKRGDFPMVKYLVNQGMDVNADVVKQVCLEGRSPGEGQNAGPNDGTYYGPDGESILAFLHEQGQRF